MSTPNPPNPETDQASNGLIMVVDDSWLLETLQTFLQEQGYGVISAESGQQALEALHVCSRLPDLIITDMWVRDMNGAEFALEVRKEPTCMRIPIIFLVALDGDNRKLVKMVGMADYLHKPFAGEELLSTMETLLKRRREIN